MNSPGGQVVTVVVGMFGWVEIDSNGGFSRDRVSRLAFAAACFFFPVPFRVSRLFSLPAPAALAQWLVYMAGGALGLMFWECNHRGVGERLAEEGERCRPGNEGRSGGRGVEGQNAQQDPFKSGFPPFFPCRAWSVRACLLGGLLAASRSRCEGARGGTSGTPPRDGKQPYLPSVRCWGAGCWTALERYRPDRKPGQNAGTAALTPTLGPFGSRRRAQNSGSWEDCGRPIYPESQTFPIRRRNLPTGAADPEKLRGATSVLGVIFVHRRGIVTAASTMTDNKSARSCQSWPGLTKAPSSRG